MKVIAVNGSPNKDGNTAAALKIMEEELKKEEVETTILHIGKEAIRGCTACYYCKQAADNLCVFNDDPVNSAIVEIQKADGMILGSPTYYGGVAGTMKSFLDRVFYAGSGRYQYKVATAVAVARRAGGVDTLHQLHNYLSLAETVIPPSQYWPAGYGMEKKELLEDDEGVQTIRKNARAMAWLLKIVNKGKNKIPLPQKEQKIMTNFIR